jgi:hypothetical protein
MSGEPSCIHMEVCRFPCIENCDYYHPYQSEREKVLDELHNWFMNYCEGNEEADLEMAFIKAEFRLRQELRQQAGEPEFNPDDYVEENPYRNPNGHPDKLRQQAGEP